MVKITDEMKDMIKTGCCLVATADQGGWPSIGPKGSVMVVDDSTLAFGELVGKKTFSNIKENPKVAVAVVDFAKRSGYRFVGEAGIETAGALYEKMGGFFEKMKLPRPRAVIRINVNAVFDLSVKNPGMKIC